MTAFSNLDPIDLRLFWIHDFSHKSGENYAYIISPLSMEVQNRREYSTARWRARRPVFEAMSNFHRFRIHMSKWQEYLRFSPWRFFCHLSIPGRCHNWLFVGYPVLDNVAMGRCRRYWPRYNLHWRMVFRSMADTQNSLGNFGPPYLNTLHRTHSNSSFSYSFHGKCITAIFIILFSKTKKSQ